MRPLLFNEKHCNTPNCNNIVNLNQQFCQKHQYFDKKDTTCSWRTCKLNRTHPSKYCEKHQKAAKDRIKCSKPNCDYVVVTKSNQKPYCKTHLPNTKNS